MSLLDYGPKLLLGSVEPVDKLVGLPLPPGVDPHGGQRVFEHTLTSLWNI